MDTGGMRASEATHAELRGLRHHDGRGLPAGFDNWPNGFHPANAVSSSPAPKYRGFYFTQNA